MSKSMWKINEMTNKNESQAEQVLARLRERAKQRREEGKANVEKEEWDPFKAFETKVDIRELLNDPMYFQNDTYWSARNKMGDVELKELLEVWLELYGHNYTGEETDEIRRILKSNDKQVIFQAVHFYVDGM